MSKLTMHPLQTAVEELMDLEQRPMHAVKNFIEAKKFFLEKKATSFQHVNGTKQYSRQYTFTDAQEKMICILESSNYREAVRIIHMDEKQPTDLNYHYSRNLSATTDAEKHRVSKHHTTLMPMELAQLKGYFPK